MADVRRKVRSDDPTLSPEANRILTEELRESLGTDEVVVDEHSPDRSGDAQGGSPLVAALVANRALIAISFALLLVVGAVVSLVTGNWWAVVMAAGVHAVGTLLVAGVVIQLTTEVEHASPGAAARLEEEGVGDADRLLSERLEDYAGSGEARRAAEVISPGFNERTGDPRDQAPASAAQQRTTLTPTGSPGRPGGSRFAVAWLPRWVVLGSFAVAERARRAPIAAVVVGGVVVFTAAMGFVAGYW